MIKAVFVSMVICLCGVIAANADYQPYTFSSLAGYVGYGSADGTGSAAQFNGPSGAAVDRAGNVYVADTTNDIIRKITPAGVVTTLAGLAGNSGSADGTGSAARFQGPWGVAVDSTGNIYVTDGLNNTVRKITSAGVVSTLAGLAGSYGSSDGKGTAARFNNPRGIALDSSGNAYVADGSNSTIRKINTTGSVSTIAGLAQTPGSTDGIGSSARFDFPEGIAVTSTGTIYVSDFYNYTIRKIDSAGIVTTLAGSTGNPGNADGTGSSARFNALGLIAVDSAGNIYVADVGGPTVRKVTPSGVVTTLAGLPGTFGRADGTGSAARFNEPYGVAVDSAGYVYICDYADNEIRKITASGDVSTFAGSGGSLGGNDGTGSIARFWYPHSVAVDIAGYIYVADLGNSTIRKITPGGVVSTLAGLTQTTGSTDGVGGNARFNYPKGIAVDRAGNLYVADTDNNTVRRITPDGVVSTLAGSAGTSGSSDGSGSNARFDHPEGIAVDAASNVYVADTRNGTIRKINSDGLVTTFAGLAGSVGSNDGAGSTARFFSPAGVAVDSAGNVYVADSRNNTIRKIDPTGVVTTFAGYPGSADTTDGTGSSARFSSPEGVAIDSANYVYVADTFNDTIRKISPSGVVRTLGGRPNNADYADGAGYSARFSYPYGIAVDTAGNICVADTNNNTIRIGTPPVQPIKAASRKLHTAAGTSFDLDLPRTKPAGIECRTGGASNDYSLVFTFANTVSIGGANVASGSGSVVNFTATVHQVTVNLTGVANAQTIVVALTGVNDGTNTGEAFIRMAVLTGDTNGDGFVNSGDIAQTKSQSGASLTNANFREDLNADGFLNSGDIALVKSKSGTALP